ncbi:MAG: L-glutamate gamma-semialdehyde dehydrogenase [Gemmatimonadetes bacterium]|nr:L-glutamate gamma-semialdehyde dehydrogenase [Gemmatimonadota bacterium]
MTDRPTLEYDYRPTEYLDFSQAGNRRAMEAAIARVESRLGREYPMWIGGREMREGDLFTSVNPNDPAQVVGRFQTGSRETAERSVDEAWNAFPAWATRPARERADILFRAADLMRDERLELAAWMIFEVGKTWSEADSDVAEAIDFLAYYAHEMLRYDRGMAVLDTAPDENHTLYIPLGVGAVISPWNFPLAILTGMSSAPLVAGNTICLKPAGDSAAIGYQYVRIMHEAGLPADTLNFLTGAGSVVGNAVVVHPRTRFVSFTGSKEVGLQINELAAKTVPGQRWIKRVVAEMGGKDAMVIDRGVDVDAAAEAVRQAAFGFQGQKCSACSRAIVHEAIYDEFVEKLAEKTRAMRLGPSRDPAVQMGAVVSENQYRTVRKYIEIGRGEGRLVTGGETPAGPGYLIPPTIIADVAPGARIEQEEIFGPVLAVIKARDFDDGLRIANDTEFGLTGGIFSNDPVHIERARREFFVGNLYINRKCTGALVGAQPFGGFNMSGTDSKAGGRDYLGLFLQAKSITERRQAPVERRPGGERQAGAAAAAGRAGTKTARAVRLSTAGEAGGGP